MSGGLPAPRRVTAAPELIAYPEVMWGHVKWFAEIPPGNERAESHYHRQCMAVARNLSPIDYNRRDRDGVNFRRNYPVAHADLRTARDDYRAAATIACGVPLELIDRNGHAPVLKGRLVFFPHELGEEVPSAARPDR